MDSENKRQTSVALEKLEAGVAQLQSEERWIEYLRVQSRFHRYSFGNALLIALQHPTASRVAGFHTWLDLGYHVRRGEKGIAILAPVTVRKPVETGDGEQTVERVVFFKTVYVFDLAQVDAGAKARPLPTSVPGCERLTADAPAEQWDRLVAAAAGVGFRVELTDQLENPNANGDCDLRSRIRVRPDLAPAQRIKTLAHELGHAVLHRGGIGPSKEVRELEAESVAFAVCEGLGIDSSGYSFGYVSSWTGADAANLIKASGELIQKAAGAILEGAAGAALRVAA